jgi:hypothetical protein
MVDETSIQPWDQLKEIGESERHFNDLQVRYRLLASTWLLASFAGMGFVLTKPVLLDEGLILCLVSAGGTIGVTIIWVLDLLGYHKLLAAYFLEGLRIEDEYSNLPQVRWTMLSLGTVGTKAQLFYFTCALAPVLSGLILLLPSLYFKSNGWNIGQFAALGVLLAIVIVIRVKKEDSKHKAKYEELKSKRLTRKEHILERRKSELLHAIKNNLPEDEIAESADDVRIAQLYLCKVKLEGHKIENKSRQTSREYDNLLKEEERWYEISVEQTIELYVKKMPNE